MGEIKTTIENGQIKVEISTSDLWEMTPEEEREAILQDEAYWSIISSALEYELGVGFSTPSFNYTTHRLRKMIVTNSEFVNDITVSFVKTILTELARSEQKRRRAESSFWELYHRIRDYERSDTIPTLPIQTPSDNSGDSPRFSSDDVKKDIISFAQEILK